MSKANPWNIVNCVPQLYWVFRPFTTIDALLRQVHRRYFRPRYVSTSWILFLSPWSPDRDFSLFLSTASDCFFPTSMFLSQAGIKHSGQVGSLRILRFRLVRWGTASHVALIWSSSCQGWCMDPRAIKANLFYTLQRFTVYTWSSIYYWTTLKKSYFP